MSNKLSILSWNSNGIVTKREPLARYLSSSVASKALSVVGVLETHCDRTLLPSLHPLSLIQSKSAVGQSGGLAVWARKSLRPEIVPTWSDRLAAIDIIWHQHEIRIIFLYGFSNNSGRNSEMLKEINHIATDSCIVIGDFNDLRLDPSLWVDGFKMCGIGPDKTWMRRVKTSQGLVTRSSRIDRCYHRGLPQLPLVMHWAVPVWKQSTPLSDHRPISIDIEAATTQGGASRWSFPDWCLDSEWVSAQIKQILDENHSWWESLKQIRRMEPQWTAALLTHDAHSDDMWSVRKREWKRKVRWRCSLRANPTITSKLRAAIRSPASGDRITIDEAFSFYSSLYSGPKLTSRKGPLSLPPIEKSEVITALSKLKLGTATGPSGTTPALLAKFSDQIADKLVHDFNEFLSVKVRPVWKKGILTLIPKTGDLGDIGNWRPISLLNVEWKIFTRIIDRRIRAQWESRCGDWQIGFLKGHWMGEHHLTLQALLKTHRHAPTGGVLFIDFRKAYDSVFHTAIAKRFMDLGGESWSELILRIIGGQSSLRLNGSYSREFEVCRGVRQGDVISPIIFNLVLAPYLDNAPWHGCLVGLTLLKYFAFADDLSLVVRDDDDVQKVLEWLHVVEREIGLSINPDKTVFLPFECSSTVTPFRTVESFKLLGVYFNRSGDVVWTGLVSQIDTALNSLDLCFNPSSLKQMVELVNSYVLSKSVHYLRVAKMPSPIVNRIYESIFRYFGKKKTRVGKDRVLTPVDAGGYGLWNIGELNQRMLAAWKVKWCVQQHSAFHEIVNWWNDITLAQRLLSEPDAINGPLTSLSCTAEFAPFWKDLAEAFVSARLSFLSVGQYNVVRSDDSLIRAVSITAVDRVSRKLYQADGSSYDSHSVVPMDFQFSHLKLTANILWNSQWLSCLSAKLPKRITVLRLTPAQTRHFGNSGAFLARMMEVWHSNCLRDYTKFWYLDCLHTNLSVAYTKTLCNLCGEEIHYDHFLASCPFLDTLAPAWTVISHTSYALVSHFIYLLHCDRHHLGSMLRVARKLCSRNCIKKRDRDVILRKLMKLQKLV